MKFKIRIAKPTTDVKKKFYIHKSKFQERSPGKIGNLSKIDNFSIEIASVLESTRSPMSEYMKKISLREHEDESMKTEKRHRRYRDIREKRV